MKVSELISKLEKIKKTDGDIHVLVYCGGEELNAPFVSTYECIYLENDYDFTIPDDKANRQKCVIIKGEWQ